MKLKINQKIILKGKTYEVIGIDTYSLKNVLNETKEWISYTLKDQTGEKTWVSYGVTEEYFVEWTLLEETEYKNEIKTASLNTTLSGIANITFEGNPGFSTPFAEIIWTNTVQSKYDFVAVERFLKQNGDKIEPLEPYYNAGKLLKEFKINP
jgi:hypothetical protein